MKVLITLLLFVSITTANSQAVFIVGAGPNFTYMPDIYGAKNIEDRKSFTSFLSFQLQTGKYELAMQLNYIRYGGAYDVFDTDQDDVIKGDCLSFAGTLYRYLPTDGDKEEGAVLFGIGPTYNAVLSEEGNRYISRFGMQIGMQFRFPNFVIQPQYNLWPTSESFEYAQVFGFHIGWAFYN